MRKSQRGAETLEFIGVLPVVIFVMLLAWQGLVLLREQSEAADDARTIARAAVICNLNAAPPTLTSVDPAAKNGTATVDSSSKPYVSVRVTLPAVSVMGNVDLHAAGFPNPAATVVMRHEPC